MAHQTVKFIPATRCICANPACRRVHWTYAKNTSGHLCIGCQKLKHLEKVKERSRGLVNYDRRLAQTALSIRRVVVTEGSCELCRRSRRLVNGRCEDCLFYGDLRHKRLAGRNEQGAWWW
jgi:hypothetical protein